MSLDSDSNLNISGHSAAATPVKLGPKADAAPGAGLSALTAPFPEETVRQMNPVSLAFIGDAVFELLVRRRLMGAGITGAGRLHRAAVEYVRAGAQSADCERVLPLLTPEESDIFRRGRNSSTTHVPKNAAAADYRRATALEALFGYLYLTGRYERVWQIFCAAAGDAPENV